MVRTVSTSDAQSDAVRLLDSVRATGETVLVERDGEPYAAIISAADYALFEQLQAASWALIDELRARNAHLDPDEILEIVTAEVELVRREG